MPKALCLIRPTPVYRRNAFLGGLRVVGYDPVDSLRDPKPDDILVTWNRYGHYDEVAKQFERAGARVVVIENGYLGKSWRDERWFAAALGQHNGGGTWRVGDPSRWDSLNVELAPWRVGGKERVILEQRGIGSNDVRSPDQWAHRTRARIGGRIRPHPGNEPPKIALDDDLKDAASVVTWGSSAALQALIMGIPVWFDFPRWIGGLAARPLKEFSGPGGTLAPVKRSDTDRLAMFRNLIWAMWRVTEVEDGSMFNHLLARD